LFLLVFALARARPCSRPAIAAAALVAVALAALPGVAQVVQDEATGFYRKGCEPVTASPPYIPPGTLTRATGSFANPNLLAGHVLLLAPLGAALVALVLRRRRSAAGGGGSEAGGDGDEQERVPVALALGLTVALAYAGVVLTFSRAAIFFALVAIAVAVGFSRSRYRVWLAALGIALALGSALVVSACGSEAGAGYGRTQAWKDAVSLARESPVTGVGLGRAGDVLRAGDPRATTQHAHNLFLNWWAEAGTGALVAWLWLFAALGWRTARTAWRTSDPLACAALAALVGFAGISLLDHPANVDRVATAFWVVAGLAAAIAAAPGERPSAGSPLPSRTTSTGPSSRAP
jgi:O-antigen ligase